MMEHHRGTKMQISSEMMDGNPDFYYWFVLYSWNGTTNTDWSTKANWSRWSVPTASDDIIIGDKSNDPVIGSGVDVCGAI